MSGYFPSGKTARQYTNNRAKIRISEARIIDEFLKKVAELLSAFYKEHNEKFTRDTEILF